MKEQKLLPKRRFEGFKGWWELRKLGDTAEFNPKSTLPDEFNYVDLEAVNGTELTGYKVLTKRSAPSRAQRLAMQGDLFYQTVRPYQKNNFLFDLTNNNYVFSTGYAQLRPNIDSYFLFSLIQEDGFINTVLNRCTGTGYPSINSSDLADIEKKIPINKKEQQKIGEFFKRLDQMITLEQRKLEKTKALKSAYLAEMFPADGERVPKRRFAGFTGEWKQRRFEEEIELYSGLTYSPIDVNKSGTFVLRSSNVQNGEIVDADNVYVNSEIVNSDNVRVGDIIVVVRNGSRSLIGKHAKIKKIMDKTVIGAFMTGIRSGQSNFINALLDTQDFKREVDKNLGATINQITNGMFRDMNFLFPADDEQQKIGEFFKQLDDTITNHQRKLDKLKAMKQAYLQEMFV